MPSGTYGPLVVTLIKIVEIQKDSSIQEKIIFKITIESVFDMYKCRISLKVVNNFQQNNTINVLIIFSECTYTVQINKYIQDSRAHFCHRTRIHYFLKNVHV